MANRTRARTRKIIALGVALTLAGAATPAAAAAAGQGTPIVGALPQAIAGEAAPTFTGPTLPHNIYVVALHGGDGSYPPFSIPAVRDAARAAGNYWVGQSNGAVNKFQVAGESFLLWPNPCSAINDTSSLPAAEWLQATKLFPSADFNVGWNHLVLVAPPGCGREGSVVATRGEYFGSGGKSLVGGVDVQTLARGLGTNMSLGTTSHAFERNGELVEKSHLGFFGPQSYSFDAAGPGALEVGYQHALGLLPREQLEHVASSTTVSLTPVTQSSGLRGATFVDPVSDERVFVEYRDGKGLDAGTAYTQSEPGVNLDEVVPDLKRDCEREHGKSSSSCSATHVFAPGVRVYHVDDERNATTIGLPRGLASQGTLQRGDVLTGPGGGYTVSVTELSAGSATVEVEVHAGTGGPKPGDPAPGEPGPGDPAPHDPAPGGPQPGDPTPADPVPGDLAEARLVVSATGSTFGTPATVDVTVEATEDAEGDVVVLDGREQVATATLRGGAASVTLPADLPVGRHDLAVRYEGSDAVGPAESPVRVRVKKARPTISAQVPTAVRGKRAKVRIAVDSALVPSGKVAAFLDGKKRKTLSLKKGKASYRLPKKLGVGRHTLKLRFLGGDGFTKSTQTTKVRVWRSVAKVKGLATGTKRVKARSVYRDTVRLSSRGIVQRKTAKGWKRVGTLRPGRSTLTVRAGKKGSVRKFRVVIKKRGHVKGVRTKALTLRAR